MSKPRRGGLGIRYIYLRNDESEVRIDLPLEGYKSATNNQMELQAVIDGLNGVASQFIEMSGYSIEVRTDSKYVSENKNNAVFNWSKRKWCNEFGKPIENAELWKELLKAIGKLKCRVDIKWIKGHAKDVDNKAVDKLAKNSTKILLNPALSVVKVRRKKFPGKTIVGSIKMDGQRITVYIITDSYMRLPKQSKYRIQVFSKMSRYYRNIDFVYSTIHHHMKSGHYYAVRLNDDNKNPQIIEVYKEFEKKLKFRQKPLFG